MATRNDELAVPLLPIVQKFLRYVERDEAIHYAKRLEEEKVPVVWKHYKTAYHGACSMPDSLVSKEMIADICNYLKEFI
ncbi:hypothetical protein Q1695_000662 [Nippostrongylus brasiliensis]|nr:hypothetical protein Q1695_000662 [Nippostrongylus brasiliensis]